MNSVGGSRKTLSKGVIKTSSNKLLNKVAPVAAQIIKINKKSINSKNLIKELQKYNKTIIKREVEGGKLRNTFLFLDKDFYSNLSIIEKFVYLSSVPKEHKGAAKIVSSFYTMNKYLATEEVVNQCLNFKSRNDKEGTAKKYVSKTLKEYQVKLLGAKAKLFDNPKDIESHYNFMMYVPRIINVGCQHSQDFRNLCESVGSKFDNEKASPNHANKVFINAITHKDYQKLKQSMLTLNLGTMVTRRHEVNKELKEFSDKFSKKLKSLDLKKKEDVIEFACWAKATLIDIHPFYDGNGRTSRALVNAILKLGNIKFQFPKMTSGAFYESSKDIQDTYLKYAEVMSQCSLDNYKPLKEYILKQI